MDKFSYRVIVITVCSVLLILVIGGLNLAVRSGDIPLQISALASTVIAYVAGLITPIPKKDL